MSFEITRVSVTAAFKNAWNTSLLYVIYENQANPQNRDGAWGRFSVLQGETDPMALGNDSVRGIGFATLQIFIPEGGGTKIAMDCADAFAVIFDKARLQSGNTYLTFNTSGLIDAGERQGYLQKNIRVQFRRDTLS